MWRPFPSAPGLEAEPQGLIEGPWQEHPGGDGRGKPSIDVNCTLLHSPTSDPFKFYVHIF